MAKKEILNTDALTVRVNAEPVVETAHEIYEQVADTLEDTVDILESIPERVVTAYRNNPYLLVGVALVAVSTGAYIGYRYGFKKAGLIFEAKLDEETEAIRAHHKRLYKEGFLDTPEGAVQALIPEEAATSGALKEHKGKAAQRQYNRISQSGALSEADQKAQERAAARLESLGPDRTMPGEVLIDKTDGTIRTTEIQEVSSNVFEANLPLEEWDYRAEILHRSEIPEGTPYVISADEYHENDGGYTQGQLAYYAKDDTLTDEKDMPIENTEEVVGQDNLDRFGHGSDDRRIVFVRNDKLQMDWEIVRSEESYAKAVLGMDEEPDRRNSLQHSAMRRRRSADE